MILENNNNDWREEFMRKYQSLEKFNKSKENVSESINKIFNNHPMTNKTPKLFWTT